MRTLRVFCAPFLAAALATSALGQNKTFSIGADGGAYFPSNSVIRNAFGASIFNIGPSFGPSIHVANGKFGVTGSAIHASKNGNTFLVLQGMVDYEKLLGKPIANMAYPYVKVAAGLAYADYSFDNNGSHFGAKRFIPTSQVELGIVINNRFKLAASYNLFSSVDGFNFDGLELKLTYSIIQF